MPELPSGTVTFLFTDLEGSTRLWEEHPEAMPAALVRHDEIVRRAIEGHGGVVFSAMGDGMAAAFASPAGAVAAALETQCSLRDEPWGEVGALRARMGLHAGEGALRADGQYVNQPLNWCARLMAVAHGGQVVISDAVEVLVRNELASEVTFVDLGEHRLRDLAQSVRVFQLCAAGLPREFPPLRSLDALPGNLPRQVTTFVGRDDDVAALTDLLLQRSLVTLTGVGGVGKTRLAIQVAAELVPDYPDGAWLCELASVSNPDAVWDTLAASLAVHPSPGRSLEDSVMQYLGPKRLLLVLDNCEHLLDATATAVDRIGQRCPGVAVLATSREGLAVAGEQLVAVRSLGLPAANASLEALSGAAAVQLFVDRAHDAKADFALTDRNAAAVAQLCRRLDGIPLAIELAAARVRSLTPEALVARLDQRFKLLTRGSRAALERHQTLRNTIDWSYDLLDEREREALNRLSVFAGGADLAAAESVVSGGSLDEFDVAEVLSQLVDKSLVVADEDDAGGRYRLFESIRQYAQERLEAAGDAVEVRRRHADHYVAVAEAAGPRLRSGDQIAVAAEAARETDNFRAALDWAAETPSPDHALRLVAPVAVNGMTIGYAAMDWADTAVDVPGAPEHPLFPRVASWAIMGATFGADLERAAILAAKLAAAEAVLDSRQPAACQGPAVLEWFGGDLDAVSRHAQDWVARAREADDSYELGHALIMHGAALQAAASDANQGVAALEEAVRIGRDTGIVSVLSIGLTAYAGSLPIDSLDDAPHALALLDEAIDVGMTIGDRQAVASAQMTKASIATRLGHWAAALRAIVEAAELALQFGVMNQLAGAYWMAALSFVGLGHLEPAAVLVGAPGQPRPVRRGLGAATDSRWVDRSTWGIWARERVVAAEEALLAGLGEQRLAELRERGAGLENADLVAYLRAEVDRVVAER